MGKYLVALNIFIFLYWVRLMWRNTPTRRPKQKKVKLTKSYFGKIENTRNFFGS